MSQSNLNPKEQALLFDLLKKSGQQPTSGGMDQSVQDPGAQQDFSQGPLQQQPGDKMHPEEAMKQIMGSMASEPQTQQQGLPMKRDDVGRLFAEVPSSNPILKFFGKKDKVQATSGNFYDSLVGAYGKDTINTLIPGETPVTPEGKPFISAKTKEQLESLLPKNKTSPEDKPNQALGKAMLAKVTSLYGADNPIVQNLKEYLNGSGGISASKLSEFNGSFGSVPKENDFIKGANGMYLMLNRGKGTFEPVPGQTTGILDTLGNPANMNVFNSNRTRFDSDPVVKSNRAALDLLGNASSILESNNPSGIGVLFSNIAKSVGKEAGVLTEGDISRSVGDPGMGARLSRWYNKNIDFINGTGQLRDEDVKDFRGLFRDIAAGAQKRYDTAVEKHVRSTKAMLPDLSEEFIKSSFDVATPFVEATNRKVPGEATNYAKTGSIATAADYMSKFKKGK